MKELQDIDSLEVGDEIEILEDLEVDGDYNSMSIRKAKLGYFLDIRLYRKNTLKSAKKMGPYTKETIVGMVQKNIWSDQNHRTQ